MMHCCRFGQVKWLVSKSLAPNRWVAVRRRLGGPIQIRDLRAATVCKIAVAEVTNLGIVGSHLALVEEQMVIVYVRLVCACVSECVLPGVGACCRVLSYDAVCCRVLLCVDVYCRVLPRVAVCHCMALRVVGWWCALVGDGVCRCVLVCVGVCWCVLVCVGVCLCVFVCRCVLFAFICERVCWCECVCVVF